MKALELKNIGQISHAELQFGHLTVLVGPQASNKSIIVQWLKFLLDASHIQW
jgi:predicted ATPase